MKKELLDGVNGLIGKAENLKNLIEQMEDDELTIDHLRAEFLGGMIMVRWQAFRTVKDVDLEYYAVGLHEEWQHSVNKYLKLHNTPVDAEDGFYRIGGIDDLTAYTWKIRMRVGDWYSEPVTVDAFGDGDEGDMNDNPNPILHGFWDDDPSIEFVNVGKSMSKNIGSIVDRGLPGIGIIEGFSEDRGEIRKRLKDSSTFIQKYKPEHENLFTILTDEPFSEGKNAGIMEQMIDDAKEIIGQDYKFAFTFKELAITDLDRPLPKNTDWLGINFYPFRHQGGVQSKEAFMARFGRLVDIARQKVPGAKIFIVGQAFHGGKWVDPPLDAVNWYFEALQKHNISLILWWKLGSSFWTGAKNMPAYLDRIEQVYHKIKQ